MRFRTESHMRDGSRYVMEQMRRLREIFDENSQDGTVAMRDMGLLWDCLGWKTSEDQRLYLAKEVQVGGDRVEFDDVLAMYSLKTREIQLRPNELKQILAVLGERLTDDEVRAMIHEADLDGDGHINYHEFVNMMLRDK